MSMCLVSGALCAILNGCGSEQERYELGENIGHSSSALSVLDDATTLPGDSQEPLRLSASRNPYYMPRDFIAVAWRDCDDKPGDWVAIAPDGSSDTTVTMRVSTNGRDGAYAFGPLPAGTYRARYFSEGAAGKTQVSEPVTIPALFSARFLAISEGAAFGCGITPHRRVRCWGRVAGILGNAEEDGPATVVPGISNAVQVSAGVYHACAVLGDGTIRCWGANPYGELGNGTRTGSWAPLDGPVTVVGINNAVSVSAGDEHTCALLSGGKVHCWGAVWNGGPSGEVPGISDAISVSVGGSHACVLLRNGKVNCWGDNYYDQLGIEREVWSRTPVEVVGVLDAVQVKAGTSHTCALLHNGEVKCWGANRQGQVGNASFSERAAPVTVTGITDAVALSAGSYHNCILAQCGKTHCWGTNYNGALGNGIGVDVQSSAVPVEVTWFSHVEAISAGNDHTCVLHWDGQVHCWGSLAVGVANGAGQGSSEIGGFGGALSLSAGADHTCAVTPHGRVLCWGTYDLNEVPDGGSHTYRVDLPTPVRDINGALSVSAGGEHSCAVLRDGAVRCWGAVGFSQSREDYPPELTAIPIPGLPGAVAKVSAGWAVTCAVLRDGRVSCWGQNDYGQRGDGTDTLEPLPTLVTGIGNAVDVSAQQDHACAVLSDGTLRCWGSNQNGQLGNGSVESATSTPVPVVGVSSAVGVGTSREGTCAIMKNGTVSCWGNGRAVPERVMGVANATSLSVGARHSCARIADGRVLCWGSNEDGQLGTGTNVDQAVPVQMGGIKDALQVASGGFFTCVLHSQSRIRCWGYGGYGQFGDGWALLMRRPNLVLGLIQ